MAFISVGVGGHRCLEAAAQLARDGIEAQEIDLRRVVPLDEKAIYEAARRTGRILVVGEDHRRYGLSGEIAPVLMETDINCRFRRVCTAETVPFDRRREDRVLPNVGRIVTQARALLEWT